MSLSSNDKRFFTAKALADLATDEAEELSADDAAALDAELEAGILRVAPKAWRQEGKPRPSLLPLDVLIKYVVAAYEEGVIKYERESWRQGFYVSDLIDAAQRHIEAFFWRGEDYDPAAAELGVKKHHLAGAIFSLLSILHTLDLGIEALDDRAAFAVKPKEVWHEEKER
jgi:hypothetical protein